jgi:hypothetical protein
MRLIALGCCAALVVACGRREQETATDTAAGTAAPAATSTVSLNDFAGRWNVVATPESATDTAVTRYTLTATADTTGWTITFPNRAEPVPVRIVATEGDSVIAEAGPFESVRRKGVRVTTRSIFRIQGGRMVGSTQARYASTGADTVLTLRTEGTRAP